MKILVVGAGGYVGGYVTDLILENKTNDVIVFDNLLYEAQYQKNVNFVYGDIRDKELQKYLDWADAVIWMAALGVMCM